MNWLFGVLFAFALLRVGSFAAAAQTGTAKPACAVGDSVVWENTSTKAYHLPGDKYYGNTKHGAYACRSAADSAGYHLAGGKSGSKSSGATTPAAPTNAAVPSAMPASPTPVASGTPAGAHHGKHHHKPGAIASPAPSPSAT